MGVKFMYGCNLDGARKGAQEGKWDGESEESTTETEQDGQRVGTLGHSSLEKPMMTTTTGSEKPLHRSQRGSYESPSGMFDRASVVFDKFWQRLIQRYENQEIS
jgi:hypothetical protein